MPAHALFIQDLAIIMLLAGFVTLICRQFKQPLVIGYILAGIIIGPHVPPFSFISDETTINTLAELGVIFLMFSLGLEFDLHKLGKVGKTAVITAALEIILMMWLGYTIGILLEWSKINSIFLGAVLSISSTTIIVKALDELGIKNQNFSQIIFGILIIEDIFAILILALLSSLALTGTLHFKEAAFATLKLSSFLVISLAAGLLFVPRLLAHIAQFKSNEVLLITVLGLCFGFCLLVAKLNYSVALGAFLIGAIVAESNQLKKIEYLINPLRDMFSAIFFVSVGLLFDPNILKDYFYPILIITGIVVVGKVISCSLGALITGHNGKTSLRVGMGLAQIGEFSFIIASLGISLKVTGNFLYSIAVCVSIITTLLTPYLIKYSDSFAHFVAKLIPKNVSTTFSVYADWMQNIQPSENQLQLNKIVNRSLFQIIINIFIILGMFLTSMYLAQTSLGTIISQFTNDYSQKSILWAGALIASLPFLVATYRKTKALSMLLAGLSIKHNADSRLTLKIRRIISEVIPILFILLIMFLIFLISARILPPLELLIFILVLIGILAVFVVPLCIKIHSKLQTSLIESIKNKQDD